MTGAAQARPLAINTGHAESSQGGVVYSGTYRPIAPVRTVSLAPDRADRIGVAPQIVRVGDVGAAEEHRALAPLGAATAAQSASTQTLVVHTTSAKGGFDWTAAAIGAATALLIALIVGGAGMTFRGRRNVALSS
jgi:hypothetical protein